MLPVQAKKAGRKDIEDVVSDYVDLSLKVFDGSKETTLYNEVIMSAEKVLFEKTLVACKFNQSKAARVLGIHRPTFRNKLIQYNIIK